MGGVSKKKLADALRANHGIITATANALNVSRQTIHNKLNADPKLREIQEEARFGIVDIAESKFIENIQAGNEKSIIYALLSLGRSREYGARIIVSDQSTLDEAIENATDQELLDKLAEKNRKIKDAAK